LKKRIRNILLFILLGVVFNITLDLIDYYLFNESYIMPTKSINRTTYSRICYDSENIDLVNIEFKDKDVIWMRNMLKKKDFKAPLFEKKGRLPMRQYIVSLDEKDKSISIHIYDDGKMSILLSKTGRFKPVISVAYLTKNEMDYLRAIVEK